MSAIIKKTPWFDGGEKPARFGVYEIANIFGGPAVNDQLITYAVYSTISKKWYIPKRGFCEAYATWAVELESLFQNLSWRGVLK